MMKMMKLSNLLLTIMLCTSSSVQGSEIPAHQRNDGEVRLPVWHPEWEDKGRVVKGVEKEEIHLQFQEETQKAAEADLLDFLKAAKADVNTDGQVDILDLVLIGRHFGEENPDSRFDLNQDNRVDILELVQVGSHFGENTTETLKKFIGDAYLNPEREEYQQALSAVVSYGYDALSSLGRIVNDSAQKMQLREFAQEAVIQITMDGIWELEIRDAGVDILLNSLQQNSEDELSVPALEALKKIFWYGFLPEEAEKELIAIANDSARSDAVRIKALQTLSRSGTIRPSVVNDLVGILSDIRSGENPKGSSGEMRFWASVALSAVDYRGYPRTKQTALNRLSATLATDPDAEVRADAAFSLGIIRDKQVVPALVLALSDSDGRVRRNAVRALESSINGDGYGIDYQWDMALLQLATEALVGALSDTEEVLSDPNSWNAISVLMSVIETRLAVMLSGDPASGILLDKLDAFDIHDLLVEIDPDNTVYRDLVVDVGATIMVSPHRDEILMNFANHQDSQGNSVGGFVAGWTFSWNLFFTETLAWIVANHNFPADKDLIGLLKGGLISALPSYQKGPADDPWPGDITERTRLISIKALGRLAEFLEDDPKEFAEIIGYLSLARANDSSEEVRKTAEELLKTLGL